MKPHVWSVDGEPCAQRGFVGIVGKSAPMRRVFALLERLTDLDAAVLITGERGTGKTLAAKALHDGGRRKNEHFVAINCAALPAHLLEPELFGCRRGVSGDESRDRKGKFEMAERGTIFLDEIGELPVNLQGKLVHALQNGEFTSVGASEVRFANVRVIAATNRDLPAMIAAHRFREDLYRCLNAKNIHMPPLRERMEDLPPLCEHFLRRCSVRLNKPLHGLTDEATALLGSYDYPGNLRQLESILEHAAMTSASGVIEAGNLPENLWPDSRGESACIDRYLSTTSLKDIERRAIEETLRKNGGKRGQTARDLGISRRGLLNKINEFSLEIDAE